MTNPTPYTDREDSALRSLYARYRSAWAGHYDEERALDRRPISSLR